MNPFNLFENKNVENIKLGLQVVKSLGLQKEFENYFNRSFEDYQTAFNNVFLIIIKDIELKYIYERFVDEDMLLSSIKGYSLAKIFKRQPQTMNYFNFSLFKAADISSILQLNPHLIDKFDFTNMEKYEINHIKICNPKLASYFNTTN